MESFLNAIEEQKSDFEKYKGVIESLLFTYGEPISYKKIGKILNLDVRRVKKIVNEMKKDYDIPSRGINIKEFNDNIQFFTKSEYGNYIKELIKPNSKQNLSQAALETLALIAYKQPITKGEIDDIRGVRSERAITTLLDRELIFESGRLEATGRPILYKTTDNFLKYFGFENIGQLPELIEFNMDLVEE